MVAPSTSIAWQPRQEHELTPYVPLRALGIRSLLVLAPHPDDEVFGCGGLLALAVAQGVQARVVVVSDGAAGGDARQRECECEAAARTIGYFGDGDALQFWRLPDRGVSPDAELQTRIRDLYREASPDWLLVPSPFEVHPDHRAVCQAAVEASSQGQQTQLVFYEVGHPLTPNLLVDISAVTPVKRAAMQCFGSQLAAQDYGEHIMALNRYRSYTLGPRVTHAEAFWAWTPISTPPTIGAVLDDVRSQLADRFASDHAEFGLPVGM